MSEYIYGTDGHEGHWFTGEEIVRCRDCRYMFDWAYDRPLCKLWADGGLDDDAREVLYPAVRPDGFCAWGERRDA